MTIRAISIKGNLEPLRSSNIQYVDRIGVELEGAWDRKPENIHVDESIREIQDDVLQEDLATEHNCHSCVLHNFKLRSCGEICGHVHCPSNCTDPEHCDDSCIRSCGCTESGLHVGECISEPLSIEDMRSWIGQFAPDLINKTCGLHVHVSMKDSASYVKLMETEFYDFFLTWFKNWGEDMGLGKKHPFWERLRGDNKYCRKQWRAQEQVLQTRKNDPHVRGSVEIRRCQLNFCYNIRNEDGSPRRTLECRLFPAFKDPAYIMCAIDSFVRCVETYLERRPEKPSLKTLEIVKDKFDNLVEV